MSVKQAMFKIVEWGISCGHHDAALCVLVDGELKYFSHAERYSKVKNDKWLSVEQIQEALEYGRPKNIFYYENPSKKKWRLLRTLDLHEIFNSPIEKLQQTLNQVDINLGNIPISFVNHHLSHAAAGFYTSHFSDAIVVVADAIGEHETLSFFSAKQGKLDKNPFWALKYPDSVGLFYSAITDAVGLKPNEDEYVLMGMAAYGNRKNDIHQLNNFITYPKKNGFTRWKSKLNFHRRIDLQFTNEQQKFDTAANAQFITEEYFVNLFSELQNQFPNNKNWIFSGGIALNCVLNSRIAETLRSGSRLYIFPNPGDAGSALGAALSHTEVPIDLENTFLGTEIKPQASNDEITEYLVKEKICGVARGRAEFGPRALGNRSLLADPRELSIKDLVNKVKRRQHFRPFGASVISELAGQYFQLPSNIAHSPYMQFVAKVKDTKSLPAITHFDGTCRIQTVTMNQNKEFYLLLQKWYQATGCPVILNTSLNIKEFPIANDSKDCQDFSEKYKIKVFS